MQLHDKLETKFRLDTKQKKALRRLNLFSVADLLFHFPVRYSHISEVKLVSQLVEGEQATVYGKFQSADIKRGYKSKILRAEGEIIDPTGQLKVVWFNQAYVAKMIPEGTLVELTGKIMKSKRGKYMANPEFRKINAMPIDTHDSLFNSKKNSEAEKQNKVFGFPVYNETRGITSKWFYHTVLKIIRDKTLDNLTDYIPEDVLKRYHLPSLKSALFWIHGPRTEKDALSARKRFAFEEVFCIQLKRQRDRMEYQKNKCFKIKVVEKEVNEFIQNFPFTLTHSQMKSIQTILNNLSGNSPMSRLLEGDVGSGKTAVAAVASYAVIKNTASGGFSNLQVAYMAPTEILAIQHFESFIKYFNQKPTGLPINVGLITGSTCRKFPSKVDASGYTEISRKQLLKWTAESVIPILIGTHALIQKSVKFKNLALAVVDEQHRFGTMQRKKLARQGAMVPHLLSMTATPIPRTLALTIYGDLDLSVLDEMPVGRKRIITEIITPDKRDKTYLKIKEELEKGRQLYVICPRIDEPDPKKELALQAKSAVVEAQRLKKEIFPQYEIGVLHSKIGKQKKEQVMREFVNGKINILCATSVVEVGVNVENATTIIIEGAERFGLAQLHQLRGRVLRSNHQAYCYIFADAKSAKTVQRLKALQTAKNGFELAELDLSLRGPGELSGAKQWGITDLGMEAIKNIKMVEAARVEAILLLEKDSELLEYPLLKSKVHSKSGELHFE